MQSGGKETFNTMIIISNQILIDFLRLNNRAVEIRNEQLGKQLNEIIIRHGGRQRAETSAGRGNEEGDPFGFPKTSMSYDFPLEHIQELLNELVVHF